jgi:hypothetical protein
VRQNGRPCSTTSYPQRTNQTYEEHWVTAKVINTLTAMTGTFRNRNIFPQEISGKKFYDPGKNAREEEIRKYLKSLWADKYNY